MNEHKRQRRVFLSRNRGRQARLSFAPAVEQLETRALPSVPSPFSPGATYPIGDFTKGMAVADLNGDGRPDLVVANGNSGTVSVLLGNGDGSFQAAMNFATGGFPYGGVVVADVNGDGRPDIVVANGLANNVAILLGNGDGTFQAPILVNAGAGPRSVAVADVNGDGKPDLIVANFQSGNLNVLLGNGNGTFQAPQSFPAVSAARNVVAADVNGDGKPDLIVTDVYTSDVAVLLGNGNGTFKTIHANDGDGAGANLLTVADVNGDGRPDLLTTGTLDAGNFYSYGASVILGNGDGTFQAPQLIATGAGTASVTAADINGDGRVDLLVACEGTTFRRIVPSQVQVFINDGNGGFQTPVSLSAVPYASCVAALDLNGDSRPDIIDAGGASYSPGAVEVQFNQISPAPATHLQIATYSSNYVVGLPFYLNIAAVNAANQIDNGFIDSVTFSGGGPGAVLPPETMFQFGNGGIQYFGPITLNTPGPQTITVTDQANPLVMGTITLTAGSAYADAAPNITSGAAATYLVGTPGATAITADGYPTPTLTATGTLPPGLTLVDQTGFGLALLSGTPTKAGTYTFTILAANGVAPNATQTFTVTVNELDGLVGRDLQNGQWWVASPTGAGAFTNALADTWSPNATWVDVHTGDFNGDGFTDLVGRDLQSGQWWVGLSDGRGHFTTTLWDAWSPGITWTDVKVGDVTGDGRDDIVGRDLQSGQWWVAVSTGSSFHTTAWDTWSPAVTWVDVQLGDVTGDGKADVIGRVQQTGQWWVGVSTGSAFSTALWDAWYPNVTWVDVQLGDFNGDGKMDLVGRVQQTGQWWVGISTGTSFINQLWDQWSTGYTWVDVKVGDLNGDGKADLVGRALETGQWFAGVSTGAAFATSLWASWSPAVTWVDVQIGDFNGDGKADIAGMVLQSGQWWVGVSTGSGLATRLGDQWYAGVTWVDVHEGVFT